MLRDLVQRWASPDGFASTHDPTVAEKAKPCRSNDKDGNRSSTAPHPAKGPNERSRHGHKNSRRRGTTERWTQ